MIILTKDRVEDLMECLDTLGGQTALPDEVILLDNSSDATTFEYIERTRHDLPFLVLYDRGHPSLGTATGRNRTIDKAKGGIVFFLDDDVVLTDKEYIATVLGIFQSDTVGEIGGVGVPGRSARSRYRLKDRARLVLKSFFVLDSLQAGKVLPSGFRSRWPSKTAWVECLPGCAMAFRRVVFNEFRFDPAFELMPYAMAEDQDLSYRAGRRWKLMWTNSTEVLHKKSTGGVRLTQYEYYLSIVRNHHYFMRKNLGRPVNYVAFWWAMVGVLLSCLVLLVARPTRDSLDGVLGFFEGVRQVAGTYSRS